MGQLIATILNVIVLLVVPLGVVQIHVVAQMRCELNDLSIAATKYVSNHGGRSDLSVSAGVQQFVKQELATKLYKLPESDVQIEVTRTKASDPLLWSHEDEFRLRLAVPYPQLTGIFSDWERPLFVERNGTINVMDYDL